MRLKDVPVFPAYLVFHDAFDNGAMDVHPYASLESAQAAAKSKNESLESQGCDEAGFYRAYATLPRKRVFKFKQLGSK